MPSTRKNPATDPIIAELEQLRRENQILNEQMQRLIRTERRLSESRQQLHDQVRRMESLNNFSLEASRTQHISRVLGLAVETILSLVPLEQGAAFIKEPNDRYRLIITRSVPGREPRQPRTRVPAEVIPTARLPSFHKMGFRRGFLKHCPSLDPFVNALERHFLSSASPAATDESAYLALPIHLREEPRILLLFRRVTPQLSYFEHLPGPQDSPFLSLFSAHLASAVENLALYHELKMSEKRARARATEIERLLQESRKAVRARDEFLSLASHELRTPITSLKNEISLISLLSQRGQLATYPKERLKNLVQFGDRELVRLTQLVNGMLDVTRITSGHLNLSFETVTLGSLVREMIARLQNEITQTRSQILLDLHDTDAGHWDRLRVEQVVTNLLTNSLKYGKGNPIEVTTWTEAENAVLTVRDHGIGIAPEDQEKIFDRFERAVSEVQAGGLGLGLYLTRQIVQAHHGTISVRSIQGKGSTFTVKIPLRADLLPKLKTA